jgi:hypothetical protein
VFDSLCGCKQSGVERGRVMFNRTIHRTIHFDQTFRLPGVDETIVAGDYEIDDNEVPKIALEKVGSALY